MSDGEHGGTDSAGVPWAGRHFESNSWGSDDGSAPDRLVEAIRRFRAREVGEVQVVDALRDSRLLIPLVAHLGEAGEDEHGRLVDKTQELSIVTVSGPDGRAVMPAFTSVQAMSAWNAAARPVPTPATRVALAAASEATDLVVLDPTSVTEFAIRRPALWAIAQGRAWTPSYVDDEVRRALWDAADGMPEVRAMSLVPGDPDARLQAAELLVEVSLAPGLGADRLAAVVGALQRRWSGDELIAARVDSLGVRLVQAS